MKKKLINSTSCVVKFFEAFLKKSMFLLHLCSALGYFSLSYNLYKIKLILKYIKKFYVIKQHT